MNNFVNGVMVGAAVFISLVLVEVLITLRAIEAAL